MHGMPQYRGMDAGSVQSQHDAVSADGRALEPAVFGLPHQRSVRNIAGHVRIVSSDALQQHNKSQSCYVGIPEGLFYMPQHHGMVAGTVQSQHDAISADGSALEPAVFGLPHQWPVFDIADHVRILSPDAI